MESLNRIELIGRLGADPKISNTQAGKKIASLNVATSESWKDKDSGERKEKTEWHKVVIYSPALAEIAEKYLHKGSKVYLEGSLATRSWEDSSGVEKFVTEVILSPFNGNLILLDGKSNDSSNKKSIDEEWGESVIPKDNGLEDDIPF